MSKLTTLRAQENLAAGTKGGIIGLGYFLYFYLKNVIGWDLENFVTLVDWEYFIEGSVMAYFGTGAVAGWYRDQQAPWKTVENEVPAKPSEESLGRITHRIEPELDEEFNFPESPVRLTAFDPQLRQELRDEEGVVYETYFDSLDHKTGGIGHLITPEDEPYYGAQVGTKIPKAQVDEWFDEDILTALDSCRTRFEGFDDMPRDAQLVMVQMVFQMGEVGVFGDPNDSSKRGFVNTMKAFREKRWDDAADGMLNSKWARQTPARAKRLAARVRALAPAIA